MMILKDSNVLNKQTALNHNIKNKEPLPPSIGPADPCIAFYGALAKIFGSMQDAAKLLDGTPEEMREKLIEAAFTDMLNSKSTDYDQMRAYIEKLLANNSKNLPKETVAFLKSMDNTLAAFVHPDGYDSAVKDYNDFLKQRADLEAQIAKQKGGPTTAQAWQLVNLNAAIYRKEQNLIPLRKVYDSDAHQYFDKVQNSSGVEEKSVDQVIQNFERVALLATDNEKTMSQINSNFSFKEVG